MSRGSVQDTAEEIREALRSITGVRYFALDSMIPAEPPAVSLGAPELTWATGNFDPDEAVWPVVLVVAADDRASENLFSLLPRVVEALERISRLAVRRARPESFPVTGTASLPAYLIETEVAL